MGITAAVRDVRTIKQLLEGAETEARRSGEEAPGPEHLLLAATALPDGSAARALARCGVDAARLRAAIEEVHAQALGEARTETEDPAGSTESLRSPATGAFRASPQAQQVFQEAVALSKAARPRGFNGGYVVAAACELRLGAAARALAHLGVDRQLLREVALLEAHGA